MVQRKRHGPCPCLFPRRGSAHCDDQVRRLTTLAHGNLKSTIQSQFEGCTLIQPEVVVSQKSGERAQSGARACTDACAASAACGRAGSSSESRTDCDGFDHMALTHAFSLDFALFI